MVSGYQFLDMLLDLHEKKFEHPREQLIILVHWTFLARNFIILKDNEYKQVIDDINKKKSVDISQFRHSLITFEFRKILNWKKTEKNSIDIDYFRENLIIHVEQSFHNENFVIQFETDEHNRLLLEMPINNHINEKDGKSNINDLYNNNTNRMELYCNHFINLPDEILVLILNKLNTVDVFNVFNINNRLDNILCDDIFTNTLTLFISSSNDIIEPPDNKLIDRFCLQILPKIHHKIKWLNLESSSMKRILLATPYPYLHGIRLYSINGQMATHLFNNRYSLFESLKTQITSIMILLNDEHRLIEKHLVTRVFIYILNMFNLHYLNFRTSFVYDEQVSLNDLLHRQQIFSQTLNELHINVETFNDCIYLLDGRLNKLHTLYIHVSNIHSDRLINHKVNC
ncbi:unnamed protein product [Adineta steineri]|uniref:F-box domain-containing protein n=1 Tax=Adineta steineri TaxID=433720 RepID=A0A814HRX4_9BILA|nr:unnamed protein product [Adineta steineri]